MLYSNDRLIPHRNFIKLLLLAGVPICHANKRAKTIMSILSDRSYNLHSIQTYEAIEGELDAIPGGKAMMLANRQIVEENLKVKTSQERMAIYYNEDVMKGLYAPRAARDIMDRFTGMAHMPCRTTRRLAPYVNNPINRQKMEALLLIQGAPFTLVELNTGSRVPSKLVLEDLIFYREYYWDCWSQSPSSVDYDLIDAVNYLNINPRNDYYRVHRAALVVSRDELRSMLGIVDEATRVSINNKLFGLIACHILRCLREHKTIRAYTVRLYIRLAKANKVNRKLLWACEKEHWREKLNEVFAQIEPIHEKRMTISEAYSQNALIECPVQRHSVQIP